MRQPVQFFAIAALAFMLACPNKPPAPPPPPPTGLQITTAHCTAPVVNKAYQCQFQASGGTQPYHWSTTGNVPLGLSINADTGLLSGIPSKYGRFQYQVVVTDASGAHAALAQF